MRSLLEKRLSLGVVEATATGRRERRGCGDEIPKTRLRMPRIYLIRRTASMHSRGLLLGAQKHTYLSRQIDARHTHLGGAVSASQRRSCSVTCSRVLQPPRPRPGSSRVHRPCCSAAIGDGSLTTRVTPQSAQASSSIMNHQYLSLFQYNTPDYGEGS